MNSRRMWAVLAILFVASTAAGAASIGVIPISQNDDGLVLTEPNGPSITLTGNFDLQNNSGTVDGDTIQLNTSSSGSLRASATARANATVDVSDLSGQWTSLTEVDASRADLTFNPSGNPRVTVGGGVTELAYQSASATTIGDDTTDFVYSADSSGSVTLYTLQPDTTFTAYTAGGEPIGEFTSDGSGTATIDVPAGTDVDVKLGSASTTPTISNPQPTDGATTRYEDQTLAVDIADDDFATGENVSVEFEVDGSTVGTNYTTTGGEVSVDVGPLADGTHSWTVTATDGYGNTETASYSWTIEHYAPDPRVEDAFPEQNGAVSPENFTISLPVNDTDFALDGDSVDVTLYLDGSQLTSETLTQNGTVSSPAQVTVGGDHTWSAVVTDNYGNQETVNVSFQTPAKLTLYNESAPTQKIETNGDAEVTFFELGSQQVYTRPVDNGTVDFAGLPLDEQFTAQIDAEGYSTRRIVIPSLFDQRRAYLLPNNATSVQVRFRLADATGTFSERSVLYIEKPITINGSTDYQIIVSDQFGVDGVTTELEEGVRYQMRIVNQDGVTAELSAFDATIDEQITLEPSAPAVQKPETQAVGYEINYDKDQERITVEYVDDSGQTDSLTVSVVSRDGDHVLKHPQTYTGGNLSLSIATNGELNQTYYVNVEGTRGDDEIDIQKPVGPRGPPLPTPDNVWVQVIAAFAILLVGGLFSVLNVGVGAVVTSLFGGVLWYFGFMSGLASGSAVALAIGISTLYIMASR